MNWARDSDSKTHAEKLNPASRTDSSSKALRDICFGPPCRCSDLYMYSTDPAAGLFSQLFTTFLSSVFLKLRIVSHLVAALLTRIIAIAQSIIYEHYVPVD